jgi:ribulose-phosphate 3-epimerase
VEPMPKIAASILSADFARLGEQVKAIERDADLLHIDCMDGTFVPVLTVGPVVVAALRRATTLPLHCHLQVERPERFFADLASAGADVVTAHVEATNDAGATIRAAKDAGLRAGLAVSPETDVEQVFDHLDQLDRVVLMSVHPGYAGQPFLDGALRKVEAVRARIERRGLPTEVEVDGGIDERTGPLCVAAGATVLAAASSIFGSADPAEGARRLAQAVGR